MADRSLIYDDFGQNILIKHLKKQNWVAAMFKQFIHEIEFSISLNFIYINCHPNIFILISKRSQGKHY